MKQTRAVIKCVCGQVAHTLGRGPGNLLINRCKCGRVYSVTRRFNQVQADWLNSTNRAVRKAEIEREQEAQKALEAEAVAEPVEAAEPLPKKKRTRKADKEAA